MRSAYIGIFFFFVMSISSGCGAEQSSVSVTIDIQHRPSAVLPVSGDGSGTGLPTDVAIDSAPAAVAVNTPAPTESPSEPLIQYRLWIEEARQAHPYGEPTEHMWQVMLCESSGNSLAMADPYIGLFQYLPATWQGDWNPYRNAPITDARSQIFATAKAWQDGNQHWWGCYGR